MEEIEVIYEDGVFRPLKKLDLKEGTRGKIRLKRDIIKETFGILKGKNLSKFLEEVEDEWGFVDSIKILRGWSFLVSGSCEIVVSERDN